MALVALSGCAQPGGAASGETNRQVGNESGVRDCGADPRPPAPVVTAEATMYPTTDEMSQALDRIRQAGESTYRDVFAGLEVVPEEGYGIVYAVPSPEFEAFVRDAAQGQCVVLRNAAHSFADLRTLQDRIMGDMDFWRKRGIDINSVGAQHDGSGVTVGTLEVEKAQAELPAHYGNDIPITVEQVGPAVHFSDRG
ncbi:hypothetical protein [Micromonospora sp. NPDC051296]|uniref:hypothetical protein n=1 Tax=Micromonospora sp. NPDC051296 TaxID=3155046 RepID=UPI00343758E0